MNDQSRWNALLAPASASAALYQADWTAQNLKEKVYPVTLRVTDLAGHIYEDHSLSFSDPAAGNSTPGTTNYPNAATFRPMGALRLNDRISNLFCGVMDPHGGYAYFATDDYYGNVIKVRLADFTAVGMLNLGENSIRCAAIDPAGDYAYFCSNSGRVIKVRLSDFVCVKKLQLAAGEIKPYSAVIDPAGAYAYLATGTTPGIVVKLRLADFTRVGALRLNTGEDDLRCAVIDPAGDYAYFGTFTAPGIVVKVRLSDFTRVGALALAADENLLQAAVIDPAGKYACFGTGTLTGIVVKIRLSDFTRVGSLTLNTGDGSLYSAAIDPAGSYAYFGTASAVVKVRLADLTRVGALALNAGESDFTTVLIDPVGKYAYCSCYDWSGKGIKVRLSDFTREQALIMDAGEVNVRCAVIDPAGGYAYFGISSIDSSVPGSVIKVRLSDFQRVGTLHLADGENYLQCAAIDPAGGYAYFGADRAAYMVQSGSVVKVRLADFTRVGALKLGGPGINEFHSYCAVIDPAAGYLYLGTDDSVVKVRLSDFTRAGTLPLNYNENDARCAVIDPAAGYAYFGLSTKPGAVLRVRLADFTRAGTLTFASSEDSLNSAVIDPAAGYAYFGTAQANFGNIILPDKVVKVRLADFTRVGVLTLESGESHLASAVIDPAAGFAYFGTYDKYPSSVVKIRLSDFSRVGALQFTDVTMEDLLCAVIDPAARTAYFGISNNAWNWPGSVLKVALGCQGTVRASRIVLSEYARLKDVRLYSHAAKGNLRLAIYTDDATKTLVWQSGAIANTRAGDWVTVLPIQGNPWAPILAPGRYWLAWQSDAPASVASYTPGAAGEGFSLDRPFGGYPATLTPGVTTPTSERWSEYLTYDPFKNAAESWRMYP